MSSRTIVIETELPTSAERMWGAMQHPASFLYVTRGLLGFPALAGRTDPMRAGEVDQGWVMALHLIPLHRHTIEIVEVDDETRSILSHEHGGLVRVWNHTLQVEPIGDARCRYRDTVTIDAGPLTALVCVLSTGFYRYRQRRWHRLVDKHLLPTVRRRPRAVLDGFRVTTGPLPGA